MKAMGGVAVILLIISVGFGVWTGVAGKPYNVSLFTVHKLAGVGFAVLTIIIAVNKYRANGFSGYDNMFIIVFIVGLVTVVATGIIMSVDRPFSNASRIGHTVAAVMTAVSGGGFLSFLIK